jgi:ABC-2 type transport system permease protein
VTGALMTEFLKARRSRVPWVTVLAFTVVALVGGLFMFILQDQQRARSLGLIGTKAALVGGEPNWPTYLSFLSQATAIGGMIVFGLVQIWTFGREFSQHTVTDLLALPTSRVTIVAAKFSVVALWCLVLPGWSGAVVLTGLFQIAVVAVMTVLLTTPVAFAAATCRAWAP